MSGCRFLSTTVVALTLLLLCSGAAVSAAGDAKKGEELFVGKIAFSNGGAPCLACHNLTGFGMADSANYGPDLSNLYENYGREGVEGVLQSLAFPSMEAIYTSRPLTESERLDLTAYFAQLSEQPATPAKSLAGPILLGLVIVFAIVALMGLRRFKGARQPLVDQVRKQRGMRT